MASSSCQQNFKNIQVGGTCWFNAIINGFLLSPVGRRFLVSFLGNYIASEKNNTQYACTSRSKYRSFFWSHVHAILSKNSISPTSKHFFTHTAIKSVAPTRNLNSGGKTGDLIDAIYTIFGNFALSHIIFKEVGKEKAYLNKKITDDFELSHAYIGLKRPHAICGYMCKGEAWTYDSASGKHEKIDWRVPQKDFDFVIQIYLKSYKRSYSENERNISNFTNKELNFLKIKTLYSRHPISLENMYTIKKPGTKLHNQFLNWNKIPKVLKDKLKQKNPGKVSEKRILFYKTIKNVSKEPNSNSNKINSTILLKRLDNINKQDVKNAIRLIMGKKTNKSLFDIKVYNENSNSPKPIVIKFLKGKINRILPNNKNNYNNIMLSAVPTKRRPETIRYYAGTGTANPRTAAWGLGIKIKTPTN